MWNFSLAKRIYGNSPLPKGVVLMKRGLFRTVDAKRTGVVEYDNNGCSDHAQCEERI